MLENGYSLARVELLNWGNFHGYQKFSLYEPGENGPLFSPHPASAILGINGSGKSTLIDALMVVLLPFEGSIRLGVTNDVEMGVGGGRTIRDYVLGKHSSNSSVSADLGAIFGRKEGCAFVLLSFVHNRHPQRALTLGRAWWYQNHRVSETQLAFLAYDRLGLQELCPGGKTPANTKVFRQHMKTERPAVQLFDTMNSYFTAASQALGRISRDDLKILNRAFFVKSISNIDNFIRENMLIEQESPNLERLLENVRNGQEIAYSIETCEAKIAAIARILRELNKLGELHEARGVLDRRARLLSLHREWSELRDMLRQREELKRESAQIEARLPLVRREAEAASDRAKRARARLAGDDHENQIASLDREAKALLESVGWRRRTFEKWRERARDVKLQLPDLERAAWPKFIADIGMLIGENRSAISGVKGAIEELRGGKFRLDADVAELREELQHIARNGTLIPRDLHAIRETAVRDLKIPANHLLFVGELIQVKREFASSRVAIESVLFPVARNLLCHPDDLQAFTRWLDGAGLRADLTAKRITSEEMAEETRLGAHDGAKGVHASEENSILDMIEVRPVRDNPFSNYLWCWLRDTFDYALVDVKRFRSSEGRLVTAEGLVKKDRRTMRKLKKGFGFSLGWDNADTVERLTAELMRLNTEHSALIKGLAGKEDELLRIEELDRILSEIRDHHQEVSSLGADEDRLQSIARERERLLEENPDLQAAREEAKVLETQAAEIAKGLLRLESDLQSKGGRLAQVESLIPSRENALKGSQTYHDLLVEMAGEASLGRALEGVDEEIERRGISRLQMEAEIKEESHKVELARGRAISMAAVNLGNYRHSFNDPNLSYEVGADVPVAALLREWSAADRRLRETELPGAQEKWRRFFDQVLLDSVKDTVNEIKSRLHETGETILSINDVLKLTNFEDLATERRYLRIDAQTSVDERIRKFRKSMADVEKTLSPAMRLDIEGRSREIMGVLVPFVDEFQKDPGYRAFVTDVRNHFQFSVHSLRRADENLAGDEDKVVEVFSGARKDAKSSAQTTQLAYALLASCLAYRFRFHDPVAGADTPRLIVLDEFGGKFDNEKPREILKLLDKMGFQSVLVSPMSKADLLADGISHLVLVHKVSASRSKVQSYRLTSREDYERLLASVDTPAPGADFVSESRPVDVAIDVGTDISSNCASNVAPDGGGSVVR